MLDALNWLYIGLLPLAFFFGALWRRGTSNRLEFILKGEAVRLKRFAEEIPRLEGEVVRLKRFAEEVPRLEGEVVRWKRLAETHMSMNEKFEQQSKDAWARYRLAGLQAGNAQEMMLRELTKAVTVLNQYRKKSGEEPIKVQPELVQLFNEFKGAHVES